jgi:hypothetical protein
MRSRTLRLTGEPYPEDDGIVHAAAARRNSPFVRLSIGGAGQMDRKRNIYYL